MDDKQLAAHVEYNDPIKQIENKEFNLAILKFGSFMSIIHNKRVSPTFILLQLLENEELRDIFKQISEIDEFQTLLLNYLNCYPSLCKSKIIKSKVTQLFKHNPTTKIESVRKKHVQQVSSNNSIITK